MNINKTNLGKTSQQISCLGLGTMYFGTKVSESVSFDIMDAYFYAGGTFLDSANKYASWVPGFEGGESEVVIGRWIKQRGNREHLFLSSKVGFPYADIPRSLKKEIIISECEKSLKRLGVDVIDLYFAHAADVNTPFNESMEAFYQLIKAGKIRYVGASNFYAWQLLESNLVASAQGWDGFCCLQQRHTYLEPSVHANLGTQLLLTPEIKSFCLTHHVTLIAYSPLLGGAYSKTNFNLPVEYQNEANSIKLKKLNEVALDLNVSPNAVVLAWMIQGKQPIIPLMTGSNVQQIEENLQALSIVLSEKHLDFLDNEMV